MSLSLYIIILQVRMLVIYGYLVILVTDCHWVY